MCRAAKKELFDARIERAKRKKVKMNKEGIRFVEAVELSRLELLEQRKMKHYEDELRLAEISGEKPPEKPENHIFKLSLEELELLVKKVDEDSGNRMLLDEALLERTKSEIEEQIRQEELQKEQWEMEHINVKDFCTPEEAIAYTKLKKAGFLEAQIKVLLTLIPNKRIEEVLELFDPMMDIETITMIADLVN